MYELKKMQNSAKIRIKEFSFFTEFKASGCFKTYVTKSDEIIYEKSTRSIRKLRLLTEEAVRIIADSNMLK